MDTLETDDQLDELRQTIDQEWVKLDVAFDELSVQYWGFCTRMETEPMDIDICVPIPATKEELTTTVNQLENACGKIKKRLTAARDLFVADVNRHIDRVDEVVAYLYGMPEAEDPPLFMQHFLDDSAHFVGSWRYTLKKFEQLWETHESVSYQGGLQRIVKDQDEDLKKWFYLEHQSRFGNHISPVKSKEPTVVLTEHGARPAKRILPLEIVLLIYASVDDLETCVVMRQVSTDWFSVFQHADPILKTKLKERSPWMTPGDGEMETWQDCVLVFVGRLNSGKWKTSDRIPCPFKTGEATQRQCLVSFDLAIDQKLPADFRSILDDCGCLTYMCEHLHIGDDRDSLVMNPWTLESRRHDEPYKIVSMGETMSIVRFDDTDITFPTWLMKKERDIGGIFFGRGLVSVAMRDKKMIVFPRDMSDGTGYLVHEIGDDHCHFGDMYMSRKGHDFSLADTEGKRMVEYASALVPGTVPQAFFSGLVWWTVKNRLLLPTFVDLKSPGKVYYREDRCIEWLSEPKDFAQSSRSRDSSHLLVTTNGHEQEVINLYTGIVTSVRPVALSDQFQQFMGFRDGKFQSYCMGPDVVEDAARKAAKAHGLLWEE